MNEVGRCISELFDTKSDSVFCNVAGDFILMFYPLIDGAVLKEIYEKIKASPTGAEVAAAIEADQIVIKKIGLPSAVSTEMNEVERVVLSKASEKEIFSCLEEMYCLTVSDLPDLTDVNGKKLSSVVFAWLLVVNDKMDQNIPVYNKPGYCSESEEVISMLNQEKFQFALTIIALTYLGKVNSQLKHHLAYPICRYADEELLTRLMKDAPFWYYDSAFEKFHKACCFSRLKQAFFFVEKYGDLEEYARLRGIDTEIVRDMFFSDVGLEADGTKKYDLGNQTVTARLKMDGSFIIELPNGKTAKSVPKNGGDETLYESAMKDFSDMKKTVKKIVKNRFDSLFREFLDGSEKSAETWKIVYTNNPVLKQIAALIVWAQGNKTFTTMANCLIDSEEKPYILTNENVKVAHPMEMQVEDLKLWKKYYELRGLKQPFVQIWEPVYNPSDIKEERYAGKVIPGHYFMNQKKRGITAAINRYNFSDSRIFFKGLDLISNVDDYDDEEILSIKFEISKISFTKYTRQVNHEIAYLDRIIAWERVKKVDQTVADLLSYIHTCTDYEIHLHYSEGKCGKWACIADGLHK